MFGFRKRRQRRRPQDPMKQVGNAAGKAIAGVLVGAVLSFLKRRK
jgi:hypothetical protein